MQTDRQTDDSIMPFTDHFACMSIMSFTFLTFQYASKLNNNTSVRILIFVIVLLADRTAPHDRLLAESCRLSSVCL